MNLEQFTALLGWCTLLNIAMLAFASLMIIAGGKTIRSLHGRWFQLSPAEMSLVCYTWLGNYKLLILMFNLMPYLALKILAT